MSSPMDWLLNYREGQETAGTINNKPKSALETLLMNLASRQAKRPGFGVRLFVQGCVLAGCDYAPNRLSGVGLVNAFKSVRDNAFRNDAVRFQKILDSIPRKNKANIDATEYEKVLAQSEAVFYYHVVTHHDRGHRPLCEPRVTEVESGEQHSRDHHLPLMTRFEDWSFLGDTSAPSPTPAPPIEEIAVGGWGNMKTTTTASSTPKKILPKLFAPLPRKTISAPNPYVKAQTTKTTSLKRTRDESRVPLKNLDPNGTKDGLASPCLDNLVENFSKAQDGIHSYRNQGDPRFVRRQFLSSVAQSRHTQQDSTQIGFEYIADANQSENAAAKAVPIESPRCPGIIEPLLFQSSIDASVPNTVETPAELSSAFFDLTDSNSMPVPTFVDDIPEEDSDGFILYHEQPTRVSLDGSWDVRQRDSDHDDDSGSQLGDSHLPKRHKQSFHSNPNTNNNLLVTCSAYFKGDSGSQPAERSESEECNETIDSPDDCDNIAAKTTYIRGSRVRGLLKPVRLQNSYRSGPRIPSLATGSGPLARAFQTQREKYSAKNTSSKPSAQPRAWVRPFPPIPSRTGGFVRNGTTTKKGTVMSFFQKVEKNCSTGLYKYRQHKSSQQD